MNLDELRAFLAVAETGSFSAAAKSLNFAREALAHQVDDLEARSGVKLLLRAADRASVTRAGEALARKGLALMGETKSILDAVRNLGGQTSLIYIEVPFGLPPAIEETALATFRKVAPAIRWRIRYNNGQFQPNSDATFALHFSDTVSENPRWKHSRVAKVRVALFASESYLKKHGKPASLEELCERDLFVWDRYDREPTTLPLTDKSRAPLSIEPVVTSPSPYLLRQFVLAGQGIALAPTSKIAAFLDPSEPLVPLLPDEVRDDVTVWMSTRNDANSGAVGVLARAISSFIATALRSVDDAMPR
jgi:DNA-binding transcriptional LysR family regulator